MRLLALYTRPRLPPPRREREHRQTRLFQRMNVLLELPLLLLEQRTHVPTRPAEFDSVLQRGRSVGVRDESGFDGGFTLFDAFRFELYVRVMVGSAGRNRDGV